MPIKKTMSDFAREARARIEETTPQIVQEKIHRKENVVVLDVRESEEFARGHLPGAILIPRGVLEGQAPQVLRDTEAEIIVYCGSGMRSALAVDTMQQMGYTNLRSLAGGFRDWLQFGGSVEH